MRIDMFPYRKDYKENAQELRKNMTPEEKHLWYDFFKKLPVTVKRQKTIEHYIVDFYIPSAKIVVEIDGSQHYEPRHRMMDSERDIRLKELGITVLRYTNFDVRKRFEGVASDILKNIGLEFEDMKFER
ncbi:MAG: DUF559 domain-containing protein [Ruminococcaceae bacterium]|nr:DUF559 domain-containing protein [Oscillospiraceae bacterium]